jgi:DNA-binding NarL/FixJ family response regulator
LLKDARGLDLVDALKRVHSGEIVLDKRLNRERGAVRLDDELVVEPLTVREHEVLRLMAHGLIGKEIAGEL